MTLGKVQPYECTLTCTKRLIELLPWLRLELTYEKFACAVLRVLNGYHEFVIVQLLGNASL
jgi:hypothetical protein